MCKGQTAPVTLSVWLGGGHTLSPGPPGQPQHSCPVLCTSALPLPAQKRSQRLRKDPSSVTGPDPGLWGPSDTHTPTVGGERWSSREFLLLSIQDGATHHVAGTQGEGPWEGKPRCPPTSGPRSLGRAESGEGLGEEGPFWAVLYFLRWKVKTLRLWFPHAARGWRIASLLHSRSTSEAGSRAGWGRGGEEAWPEPRDGEAGLLPSSPLCCHLCTPQRVWGSPPQGERGLPSPPHR